MKKYILILLVVCMSAITANSQQLHTLENENIKAVFNLNNGALIQFENKKTRWKIIPKEQSGRSFGMNIRMKDGQVVAADGQKQLKPEAKITPNGITFIWHAIRPNPQGLSPVDIRFTGSIVLTEKGLEYGGEIINNSKHVMENLFWPMIGELANPGIRDRLIFQYISYTKFNTEELYPRPTSYTGGCNLPETAFGIFHNEKQGLYVSSQDAALNEPIRLTYEILPNESYGAFIGTATSKMDGEQEHTRIQLKANRSVYTQPKGRTQLVPVTLQPYSGTWHKAADIYKEWKQKTWYKTPPHRVEWIRNISTWQQLQINSSEDYLSFKYKDIVNYAKECKQYGVDVIQLTGWNQGGQDRGVPGHDIDPRLGSFEDLKDAIAEAHRIGVKILLFTKFTWVDLTSDLYAEYKNYIAKDASGEPCLHPGYNYNTYTQLLGMNTRRFGVLCLESAECRKQLCSELQKCLDLGAAGMVYDENQHHAGHQFCFDPTHGHRVPGFLYRGADLLGRDLTELAHKSNYDFAMVGEGCYDLQSKYYATYTRADVNHIPVLRYIDPELPIACAVTDHFDKNKINMCLKDRYSISYEPRSFKGRLSEFPRLMSYGQQVDNLRKKYRDRLWYAEYKDVLGASARGNGIIYSVFERQRDGRKAVVVLNTNLTEPSVATVLIDNAQEELVSVTPENPNPVPFVGVITLQPQSVAVIWEKN